MSALSDFSELKRVHIIGVCGTLMGAFASFLKRQGIEVTGSDQNVYPPMSDVLASAGVRLMSGYRAENLTELSPRPNLVVIGNVISASNPEAKAAIEGGYAYTSLPQAMENLMLSQTRNLVVAGTHGKTTTSSLLAFTLKHAGLDPNYFIGGVSHDLPHSFHASRLKDGHPFVLEGDEYDTAFWDKVPKFSHYLPNDVILTSVEYDHADIYPDLESVLTVFRKLMKQVRSGGRVIACWDHAHVRDVAGEARVPMLTYGKPGSGARFTFDHLKTESGLTTFDVLDQAERKGQISLQLAGEHNVLNALAVWVECRELGLSSERIAAGLRAFQGVKRRQEERGEIRGVLVIDDFAHHPTAVRETLRALRSRYPGRRLIAVFEPRSATSRRKVFQKEYASAFQESDLAFIAAPFDQSRIAATDQFSSEQLVEDIHQLGTEAVCFSEVSAGVKKVAERAQAGDLVAVLSNGGFGGFISLLLKALQPEVAGPDGR